MLRNRADLLMLEANPLESIDNISQIAGVIIRGRWLSKAEIEKLRINNARENKDE
jgi:imidazolonepropionase-like amidohydrolase